ncbi:MAG: HEPN domain-containing protein [Candidatus Hydrogenedentota bacterium]
MKQNNIDYIKYRLEQAYEKLKYSRILIKEGGYKDSLSRTYYAMFNAVLALFVVRNLSARTHKDVLFLFDKQFVKEGIIDTMFLEIIRDAFYNRIDADYKDFFIASKEIADIQIKNAEIFINEIKRILKEKYEVDV